MGMRIGIGLATVTAGRGCPRSKEAEAAVPQDLLVKTALIDSAGHVRDRLRALADSGVRTRTVLARSRTTTPAASA